jgi:fumarate hydratase class II
MRVKYRIEKDTMGEIQVPKDKYWGAQTQRSKQNFKIGEEKMPNGVIIGFAILKQSAAKVNASLGKLHNDKAQAIVEACDEIIAGKLTDHFPLVVWQTGSGTQSNMNVNEVIARRGNELLNESGKKATIHPNDDVNMSQSSNDTFPTAMHVAGVLAVKERLLPAIDKLSATLDGKVKQFENVVKIGRTHLQDATPLTLGQEISGWAHMLQQTKEMILQATSYMGNLAIGGTAVGTGINAHPEFGDRVAKEISDYTKVDFYSSVNKFHFLTSHD